MKWVDIETPTHCPVLGIVLKYNRKERRKDDSPSIDRFNTLEGYTLKNIRTISWRANRIKSDATLADMRAICAYMEDN